MTQEQKNTALEMRKEGFSLQEIANEMGVTRERIRQITPAGIRAYRFSDSYERCIYPNITAWMRANRFSYTRFAEHLQLSPATLHHALTGKHLVSKFTIDAILAATGMSYEEAFKKEV